MNHSHALSRSTTTQPDSQCVFSSFRKNVFARSPNSTLSPDARSAHHMASELLLSTTVDYCSVLNACFRRRCCAHASVSGFSACHASYKERVPDDVEVSVAWLLDASYVPHKLLASGLEHTCDTCAVTVRHESATVTMRIQAKCLRFRKRKMMNDNDMGNTASPFGRFAISL